MSKVSAEKIKNVLEEVIHVDQVGFLPGRNIGEAVRIIDDVIFYTQVYKVQGFLVTVDFEKAFDTVSHSYMNFLLKKYGFGPYFCRWIEVFSKNVVSCVMNGGFSTGYFEIGRGVRQGDHLSPYLFLLIIETLAVVIRNEHKLKGILIGNLQTKIIMYADDCSIFLRDTEDMKILEKY